MHLLEAVFAVSGCPEFVQLSPTSIVSIACQDQNFFKNLREDQEEI